MEESNAPSVNTCVQNVSARGCRRIRGPTWHNNAEGAKSTFSQVHRHVHRHVHRLVLNSESFSSFSSNLLIDFFSLFVMLFVQLIIFSKRPLRSPGKPDTWPDGYESSH